MICMVTTSLYILVDDFRLFISRGRCTWALWCGHVFVGLLSDIYMFGIIIVMKIHSHSFVSSEESCRSVNTASC